MWHITLDWLCVLVLFIRTKEKCPEIWFIPKSFDNYIWLDPKDIPMSSVTYLVVIH